MIRVFLTCMAFALMALASPSRAQNVAVIIPPTLSGYGVLSVTAASVAASTATLGGPNSSPFPTGALPGRTLEVKSAIGSAGTLYVCPLGGTCSALVGIPLAPGESKTWALSSAAAVTLIAATTASAVVSW